MSPAPIYLDHAATTAVSAEVRTAMLVALESEFGNPSSRHPLGSQARAMIEEARGRVARSVGARREDVIFTSGGTEANNLALLGLARNASKAHTPTDEAQVLIGPTEHPSIRAPAEALRHEGLRIETMRLDPTGQLDIEHAASRIGPGTRIVAQMLVNNEFGTRYDTLRLARAVAARGGSTTHLHIDAVQALGKQPLDLIVLFETAGIPGSLALSAHKVHGPKGSGALVLTRSGQRPAPLFFGGGQESERRPGTENVAGIVGFGVAAQAATRAAETTLVALEAARRSFEDAIAKAMPTARVLVPYTDGCHSSPHVLSLEVPGAPAEVWLHHLEALGIFASAGSACAAHDNELSPALLALGLNHEAARRVLRFSFATTTTPAECKQATQALSQLSSSLASLTNE